MADDEKIKSYRDLIVWQRAMEAADLILDLIETGPLANRYRLAGQLEASSASIPANISEGHELGTRKQYLSHLYYARGSLAETLRFLTSPDSLGPVDRSAKNAGQADLAPRIGTRRRRERKP